MSHPTSAGLAGLSACLLAALALQGSAQTGCDYVIEYGMNPSFHTWSSRGIVFADAMTRAKMFEVFDNGTSLGRATPIPEGQLGAGWPDPATLGPGQELGALLFGQMDGSLPDGRDEPYVVTWEGTGEVWLQGLFVKEERARTAQRVEVVVDASILVENTGLSAHWSSPDPADPVRNVRVWLPGTEGSGRLFWPPYLEKVRMMNAGRGPSSWRTLDWTRVNDYGETGPDAFAFTMGSRITPASPTQGTPRGVAVEYQVAFANELGIDLHFQVPHRGEMSEWDYLLYLYDVFRVIRDGSPAVPGLNGDRPFAGLDGSLTLMLELSNEIWNPGFPVHGWMSDQALMKGLTKHEQIASQIELVFDIADGLFMGDPRLKKYIGGTVGNPAYLQQVLDALRPGFHVDALGPAAYFGPHASVTDQWISDVDPVTGECRSCPTADEIIAAARAEIPSLRPGLSAHRAMANAWVNPDGSSPRLVLYEAGQSLKSLFQPWAPQANLAQAKRGMYDAYALDLIPLLIDEGVDEVIWYSFMTDQTPDVIAPFGIWDDMNQEITYPVPETYVSQGAPKAAAIYRGPPVTTDCPLARAFVRSAAGNPLSLAATLPSLGRTMEITCDLTTTGHLFSYAFSFTGPTTHALAGGQVLLTAGPYAFGFPLTDGPLARGTIVVPNDPRLAGMEFSMQALHYGGASPFALSNAVDLVLGR